MLHYIPGKTKKMFINFDEGEMTIHSFGTVTPEPPHVCFDTSMNFSQLFAESVFFLAGLIHYGTVSV